MVAENGCNRKNTLIKAVIAINSPVPTVRKIFFNHNRRRPPYAFVVPCWGHLKWQKYLDLPICCGPGFYATGDEFASINSAVKPRAMDL